MATEKRLIYADALMKEVKGYAQLIVDVKHNRDLFYHGAGWNGALVAAQVAIMDAPTVDAVEVVHGRWVLTAHEEQCNFRWKVTAECSECQHSKGEIYAGHFSGFPKELVESMIPTYAKKVKLDNYCPNCGAKMDAEES